MSMETTRSIEVKRPRCPFCHDPVRPEDEKRACLSCMAWHHEACWGEHKGCSACGREDGQEGQQRTTTAKTAPRGSRTYQQAFEAAIEGLGECGLDETAASVQTRLYRSRTLERHLAFWVGLVSGGLGIVSVMLAFFALAIADWPLVLGLFLLGVLLKSCAFLSKRHLIERVSKKDAVFDFASRHRLHRDAHQSETNWVGRTFSEEYSEHEVFRSFLKNEALRLSEDQLGKIFERLEDESLWSEAALNFEADQDFKERAQAQNERSLAILAKRPMRK